VKSVADWEYWTGSVILSDHLTTAMAILTSINACVGIGSATYDVRERRQPTRPWRYSVDESLHYASRL